LISLQIVLDFMYENFQLVSVSQKGTHFHARCLLCGDSAKSLSKKRFHLDWKNGKPVYHCWNCGESGSFIKLYCRVKGVNYEQAKKDLFKYDSKRLKQTLNPTEHKPAETYALPQVFNIFCMSAEIPVDSVIWNTIRHTLVRFRQERKIPDKYKLYMAYKGKYKGRIIIPVFAQGRVVFFQGRRIPGTDMEPKYKNPSSQKGIIVHNEGVFDRKRYIIATEGLIDAFMVGNNGTSMLGKEVSDEFLQRLFNLTNEGVILVFDNDIEGLKGMRKFMGQSRYAREVKYFLTPDSNNECKDINDIIINNDIMNVYDFIVKNSYEFWNISVKLKI
jgi:hypothetical protein